jgi:hypothetical protein
MVTLVNVIEVVNSSSIATVSFDVLVPNLTVARLSDGRCGPRGTARPHRLTSLALVR